MNYSQAEGIEVDESAFIIPTCNAIVSNRVGANKKARREVRAWTNELSGGLSTFTRRPNYDTRDTRPSRWSLRPPTTYTPKGKSKGYGKNDSKGKNMAKGKNDSKGKTKGKNKGKGKNKSTSPVCWNFHFGNGCRDRNCPRQH